MTKKQTEQNEARTFLAEYLPPGTTVYTVVTHVAKSGMSRRIRCIVIDDGQPYDISGMVGRLLGYRRNDRDGGLMVSGCGMDMGFHLVNSLSYAMHGNKTVGKTAEQAGVKGRPFTPTATQYRAGYSLIQRWL